MSALANSGIYVIRCRDNGKVYIGQSLNLARRKQSHFRGLSKGAHHNAHLQAAYDKHGPSAFEHSMLEKCRPEQLDRRERFWINFFQSGNPEYGYNLDSGGRKNRVFSEISRAKMAKAHSGARSFWWGKKRPEETCAKIGAAQRGPRSHWWGTKQTPETRAKRSASQRGHLTSLETRAKIATSPNSKNTSGAHGVWLRKDTKRWTAAIKVNGKSIYLGCFGTRDEAASARKAADILYFGQALNQEQGDPR